MTLNILRGIMIPFIGTSLGSACVLFMRNTLNERIQKLLTGFAGGVMIAASVWSLIIPAVDLSPAWASSPSFPLLQASG